ncbi:hypothetical protein [Priestia megaterium]
MLTSPSLVIDTGVVSRYGFSGRFDILESLFANKVIVPADVITECVKPRNSTTMQNCLTDAFDKGWLEQFNINYIDHPEIFGEFATLSKRFGSGESAVLSIAKVQGYSVGSDDLRASARYCSRNGLQLMGSLGILYHAFDKNLIDEAEGNSILQDMITLSRYNPPVSAFSDVVGWFREGKGLQLF